MTEHRTNHSKPRRMLVGSLTVLGALAAVATPALAQEWIATPEPNYVTGQANCTMGVNHPEYFVAVTLAEEFTSLFLKSALVARIPQGPSQAIINLPTGDSIRTILTKDTAEADIAAAQIQSDAELTLIIEGFAASAPLSVAILGSAPTAFRLPELPEAGHRITVMKNCIEKFNER